VKSPKFETVEKVDDTKISLSSHLNKQSHRTKKALWSINRKGRSALSPKLSKSVPRSQISTKFQTALIVNCPIARPTRCRPMPRASIDRRRSRLSSGRQALIIVPIDTFRFPPGHEGLSSQDRHDTRWRSVFEAGVQLLIGADLNDQDDTIRRSFF
jgi:hypothetical protein